MKKTINVNIATQAFTLDEDAYTLLDKYLKDVQSRLSEDEREVIGDIESRFAEIFNEKINSSMRVVTLLIVRRAIEQIGSPSIFGEQRVGEGNFDNRSNQTPQPKR